MYRNEIKKEPILSLLEFFELVEITTERIVGDLECSLPVQFCRPLQGK